MSFEDLEDYCAEVQRAEQYGQSIQKAYAILDEYTDGVVEDDEAVKVINNALRALESSGVDIGE